MKHSIFRKRALSLLLTLVLTLLCIPVLPLLPASAAPAKGSPDEAIKDKPKITMSVYPTIPKSGFEYWGGHFQFDIFSNLSHLNAIEGAGTAASKWTFDLYYRPSSESGEYSLVTCSMKNANSYYKFDNNDVIYRLILDGTGFERLQKTEYTFVVVAKKSGEVQGWNTLTTVWNDATDDAYSEFTGVWPDYRTVGFKVPSYDKPIEYHLKDGDRPSFDGSTFFPGKEFIGWEAGGELYTGALPAVTGDVTYTAVYRNTGNVGDVNGDGRVTVKDLSRILQGLADKTVALPENIGTLDGKEGIAVSDLAVLLDRMNTGSYLTADPVLTALRDKTALFCGDSITMASTYDTLHPRWGWAGRIGNFYELKSYRNAGVDGASVSTCRKTNRVITQLNNNKNGKYDFVILHGSTNDAWDSCAVGSMTAADCVDVSKFDTTTFAGGLEELFARAKQYFPNAKIGYIINFRFNPGVGVGRMGDMTEYVTVAKQICEKWDIPYLDLFSNDEVYNTLKPGTSPRCFGDNGIHPNSAGYDVLYPYIAEFMAKLA